MPNVLSLVCIPSPVTAACVLHLRRRRRPRLPLGLCCVALCGGAARRPTRTTRHFFGPLAAADPPWRARGVARGLATPLAIMSRVSNAGGRRAGHPCLARSRRSWRRLPEGDACRAASLAAPWLTTQLCGPAGPCASHCAAGRPVAPGRAYCVLLPSATARSSGPFACGRRRQRPAEACTSQRRRAGRLPAATAEADAGSSTSSSSSSSGGEAGAGDEATVTTSNGDTVTVRPARTRTEVQQVAQLRAEAFYAVRKEGPARGPARRPQVRLLLHSLGATEACGSGPSSPFHGIMSVLGMHMHLHCRRAWKVRSLLQL